MNHFIASICLCAVVAVTHKAYGETSAESEAARLFEAAKILMSNGQYAEARPLLAHSLELDAEVGTEMNLAYCYENSGRLASAWSMWLRASVLAGAKAQNDREDFARARAALLEPRLLRLMITVATQRHQSGMQLHLDGAAISREEWNTAVPIDMGHHVVTANAEGARPWSIEFDIQQHQGLSINVPTLEDADDAHWRRTAALGIGAGALAAVAVGSVFGLEAIAAHDRAKSYCGATNATNCNNDGLQELSLMKEDGMAANIAFATAGVALASAAALWLAAPAMSTPSGSGSGFVIYPMFGREGTFLWAAGAW